MSADMVETSGPRLWVVLGAIAVTVITLGTLAYWRYTESERHFAETLAHMDERGPELDVEACVSEVLAWHASCSANKPLCDNGVARVLTHCLAGADRAADCGGLDLSSSKAQWVFDKCQERGTPCVHRQSCACANAYRGLDSFCRHDQKGVSL